MKKIILGSATALGMTASAIMAMPANAQSVPKEVEAVARVVAAEKVCGMQMPRRLLADLGRSMNVPYGVDVYALAEFIERRGDAYASRIIANGAEGEFCAHMVRVYREFGYIRRN